MDTELMRALLRDQAEACAALQDALLCMPAGTLSAMLDSVYGDQVQMAEWVAAAEQWQVAMIRLAIIAGFRAAVISRTEQESQDAE